MRFWYVNVYVLKMPRIVATVSRNLSSPSWKRFKIDNNWHAYREGKKSRGMERGRQEEKKRKEEEKKIFGF